jgi:hypothetical protein
VIELEIAGSQHRTPATAACSKVGASSGNGRGRDIVVWQPYTKIQCPKLKGLPRFRDTLGMASGLVLSQFEGGTPLIVFKEAYHKLIA